MGSGSEVMFQHNSNQVTEEDVKQKLRQSEVGCTAFDTASYWFAIIDLDLKLEVPGSNLPPCRYLDLFSIVLNSTARTLCVNNQLASLPPVGILNSLYSTCIWNICLFIYSVLISTTVLNTFAIKVILLFLMLKRNVPEISIVHWQWTCPTGVV